MGLDKKRFVDSDVKDDFICVICHDVLENPLSINECEHTFCSTCIKDWLKNEKHQFCPMDRSPTVLEQLRPPFRLLINLLNELKIRCQWEPCESVVTMAELDTHQQQCPYNPSNKEKEIDCPKNCGTRIKLNDQHDCIESMKKIIEKLQKEMTKLQKELFEKDKIQQTLRTSLNEKDEIIKSLKLELETKDAIIEFSDPKHHQKQHQTLPRLKKNHNNHSGSIQTLMPLIDLNNDNQNHQQQQLTEATTTSTSTTIPIPTSPKQLDTFLEPSTSRSPTKSSSSSLSITTTLPMVNNSKFYFESNDNCVMQPTTPTSPGKVLNGGGGGGGGGGGKVGGSPPKESKVRSKVSLFNSMFSSGKNPNENYDLGVQAAIITNATNCNNNNNNNDYKNDQQSSQECRLDKISRKKIREDVLPYVTRRYFHSDDNKINTMKGKAHSFTMAYEIKLLEYIAPLIGPESRVLDIGSGTGYLTCCLAHMCSFVCGVEHVKELVNKSHEIIKLHYQHLQLAIAKSDGRYGYDKMAPYDLILIEPMVRLVPDKLFAQLKPDGRIVAVINDSKSIQMVLMDSSRQIIKTLNKNKTWLSENHKDFLCDLQTQQESSGKFINLILPKSR